MNVQNFIRSSIFLLSFQALQAVSENTFHIAQAANSTPTKTSSQTSSSFVSTAKNPQTTIKKTSAKPVIIPSTKIFSNQSAPASPTKQIPANYEQMIFVPTIPTTSSFTATLQTMYTSTDLPLTTLQQLQQVYFVLEYFTKLEKIQHDKKYASLQTKYASLITPTAKDIPFISSGMDLSTDSDWQNITITQQDVINSDMWQYFLKATIADIFIYNGNFLQVIHEVETQIFSYIPSMETSYYNSDFLGLRNLAEGTRLKLLLNDLIGKKHQAQCLDWKKLSSKQLQSASSSFQSTDFYTYSHNISAWMQQDSQGKLISQKKVALKSPTKEQVFCYAMIKAAQNNLYAALSVSDNVENFITQASSSSLLPNIFEYTLDEYVYLDDFFMIQANLATQIAENNQPATPTKTASSNSVHVQSLHDHSHKQKHKKRYKPEELVKIQSDVQYTIPAHAQLVNPAGAINSRILELDYVAAANVDNRATNAQEFFSDTGSELEQGAISIYHSFISGAEQLGANLKQDFIAAGYAIRDGIIQVGYAIKDACVAAGEAIGGLGATLIGDIENDPNLQKIGHTLTTQAVAGLQQAGAEMNSAIKDFGNAIKDGIIAPMADIDGSLIGFITQDQSIGLDMTTIINQVCDSLVDIEVTIEQSMVGFYVGLAVDTVTLTTDLADAIVKSVAAIAYPNNGAGDAWAQLGNDMGMAVLGAFNGLVSATKEMFAAIMQTLTYLTSAITTIIIDVSKEATFIFELVATENLQAAKTAENSVGTYLDNHRQTIDMVSGIILAIAIDVAVTVATGGAGTAEAVALTEGMMTGAEAGAEAGVETAAVVGETAATAGETAATAASTASEAAATAGETATTTIGDTASITRTAATTARTAVTETGTTATSTLGEGATTTVGDTASAAGNAGKTAVTETGTTTTSTLGESATTAVGDTASDAGNAGKTAATTARETATTAKTAATTARETATTADQMASQAETAAEEAGTDTAKATATAARKAANEADEAATKLEEASTKADEAATKAESASTKAEEAATKAENAAKASARSLTHVVMSEGMNAAFNILGAIGASYQDELSAVAEISQEEGVKNIVSYAMDTALNSSIQQNAMIQEIEKKFNANLATQQIGLLMFQDFYTNAAINATFQSEAFGLGQEYTDLLTPQPYDSSNSTITGCLADIGFQWGLVTPINSLYPQLGLYTTTTGRPKFPYAQEIAQAPLVIDSQAGQKQSTNIDDSSATQAINQLWFNQRVMIPLSSQKATDPLQVELQFRTLYSLQTTTYTGLYLGGTFEDYRSKAYLDDLQTTGMANLNITHLAKMFVLIQLPNGTTNIGLYEKDGLGTIKDPNGTSWILYEPLNKDFTTGWPIYDMKATLQGNQLTLTLSRTDITTVAPWKKTITVSPTDQRMLGIITSGTAIEWNILQPNLAIQQIASVRANASSSTSTPQAETAREIQSLQTWAQLLSPPFGNFTLNALNKYQCINGNYIYTTTNTGIKDSNNKPLIDYVVFANNINSVISNIGINPCASTTNTSALVIISLGSGNVYDATGKIIGNQKNIWNSYNQPPHGPFAPAIIASIKTIQAACLQTLLKQTIGVFNIIAADSAMITNGLYVYTTTQTLTGMNKNPITDYLITSTISTETDLQGNPIINPGDTFGAPPSSTTQGLLSLVTGNLYLPSSLTPVNTGLDGILSSYQSSYKNLPSEITAKIATSLHDYTLATTPPAPKAPATPPAGQPTTPKPTITPPTAIIFGTTNGINMAPPSGGISFNDLLGTPQVKTQVSAPKSATSLVLQQQIASGGISFNMDLMSGPTPDTQSPEDSTPTSEPALTLPAQTSLGATPALTLPTAGTNSVSTPSLGAAPILTLPTAGTNSVSTPSLGATPALTLPGSKSSSATLPAQTTTAPKSTSAQTPSGAAPILTLPTAGTNSVSTPSQGATPILTLPGSKSSSATPSAQTTTAPKSTSAQTSSGVAAKAPASKAPATKATGTSQLAQAVAGAATKN